MLVTFVVLSKGHFVLPAEPLKDRGTLKDTMKSVSHVCVDAVRGEQRASWGTRPICLPVSACVCLPACLPVSVCLSSTTQVHKTNTYLHEHVLTGDHCKRISHKEQTRSQTYSQHIQQGRLQFTVAGMHSGS